MAAWVALTTPVVLCLAQQEAQRAQFYVEKAKQDQRQKIIQAEGEAEAAKMVSRHWRGLGAVLAAFITAQKMLFFWEAVTCQPRNKVVLYYGSVFSVQTGSRDVVPETSTVSHMYVTRVRQQNKCWEWTVRNVNIHREQLKVIILYLSWHIVWMSLII